jgi:hypothetical protein
MSAAISTDVHATQPKRVAILFFGRLRNYEKLWLLNALPPGNIYDVFLSSDNSPHEDVEGFRRLYNPVAVINDPITFVVSFGLYPNNKTCPANINNMTRHFINKKRVFALLEATGTQYDLVISSRLDLYMEPLALPAEVAPNTVYVPEGEDHTGLNDRFAYGSQGAMRHYMNIFDNCIYLLKNRISVPHPENLTLYNLLHCGVSIARFPNYQKIMG